MLLFDIFALFVIGWGLFAALVQTTRYLRERIGRAKRRWQASLRESGGLRKSLLASAKKTLRRFWQFCKDFFGAFAEAERLEQMQYAAKAPPQARTAAEAPPREAPERAAEELPAEETTVEAVQLRARQLADSLRLIGANLTDQTPARYMEQLAQSLDLLAENAQADPRDVPATLRFLNRYAALTEKLAKAYANLDRVVGGDADIRKSLEQIKAMLRELAQAYERFRLSLYENDMLSADAHMELARSLLAQDGLDGPSPFAATEIVELGGH